jgi:hypothetical protein
MLFNVLRSIKSPLGCCSFVLITSSFVDDFKTKNTKINIENIFSKNVECISY